MLRSFKLERGRIDVETGQFPAAVATNGEASDTHILDIKTLQVGPHLPMFANHVADAVFGQPGAFVNPRKKGETRKKGAAFLHMDGRIDVTQDGALGDVRRDIVHRIHIGDITQISAHWERGEGAKETARSALPKNHWAFSDIPASWRGTPTFLENQNLLENSIVGLGADKGAFVGRTQDDKSPSHVREFYRMLIATGAGIDDVSQERGEGSHSEIRDDDAGLTQERGEDWEEITLESGARVYVPCEVALLWGEVETVGTIGEALDALRNDNHQEEARAEQPGNGAAVVVALKQSESARELAQMLREMSDPAFLRNIMQEAVPKALAKHLGHVS